MPAAASEPQLAVLRPSVDKGLDRTQSTPEFPANPAERRASRFEAPKRDEEAEANRKIKAKRARETRRSTQVCYLNKYINSVSCCLPHIYE